MDKKLKKILIIILVVIVITVAATYLLTSKPTTEVAIDIPDTPQNNVIDYLGDGNLSVIPKVEDKPKVILEPQPVLGIAKEKTADDLKKIAFSFAERFGSYSNQTDYGNIEDLKGLMNEGMKLWAVGWVNDLREIDYSGSYYGVSTKALAGKIVTFDHVKGEASILVTTKRRESEGTLSNYKEYLQDVLINFVKEGDVWKTSGAFWQVK